MGSWYYLWESGAVSFVSAASREDAAFMLDEIGEAHPQRLKPVREGFFFTFEVKPKAKAEDESEWDQDDHSESVIQVLSDVEKEARRRMEISNESLLPLNLLGRVRDEVRSRQDLQGFDLRKALLEVLRKDEPEEGVQAAFTLVEASLKQDGLTVVNLPKSGLWLATLVDDIIDTQRSILFRERKELV